MGKHVKTSSPNKRRTVIKMKINGTEKHYRPSRHYVYILQVRWSDKNEYIIYRKYSDFYELHCSLLEKFPIEAGTIKASDRVIPYLPGRLIFSRTEVSKIANQRRGDLEQYCGELLKLDPKISTCAEVDEFFEPRHDDLNPPKDATKKPERSRLIIALLPFLKRYKGVESSSERTRANKTQRMRKAKSTTALNVRLEEGKDEEEDPEEEEMSISDPIMLETYVAIADYDAADKSEVSLKEGINVDIFEKNSNGWWFVQLENSQGWAPASYLDPVSHPMESDEPDPTYTGDLEKYISTQEYTATMSDEISFEKDVIVEVMHKLLDGWWIVSYQGEAGYAPAAYLIPYQNLHMVRSVSTKKRSAKPIPRRCTIKSSKKSSVKGPDRSQRDLSIYRKYSKKRKVQQPNFNAAPPPPKPPGIIEEEETNGTNYVNEAFGDNIPEDEPEYLEMEHNEECNALYENITETTGMTVSTSQLPPPAPPRPAFLSAEDKFMNRISTMSIDNIYDDIENVMSSPSPSPSPVPSPPLMRRNQSEEQLPPIPKEVCPLLPPSIPRPAQRSEACPVTYSETSKDVVNQENGVPDFLSGLKKAQKNRDEGLKDEAEKTKPVGGDGKEQFRNGPNKVIEQLKKGKTPREQLDLPAGSHSTLPITKTKQTNEKNKKPHDAPGSHSTLPASKPKVEVTKSIDFKDRLRMMESSLGMPGGSRPQSPVMKPKPKVIPTPEKPPACPKPGVRKRMNVSTEDGGQTARRALPQEKDTKKPAVGGIASRVAQFEKS